MMSYAPTSYCTVALEKKKKKKKKERKVQMYPVSCLAVVNR